MSARIVLGLGGTVDYEVRWDARAFQALVDSHRITLAELQDGPSPVVDDERGVVVTVLRAMRHGRGAECYVSDRRALGSLGSRLAHVTTLGGTCVRAALAIERLGVPSTVHLVSMSQEVRERLPEAVEWVCSAREDSLDPHLIVQFPSGAVIRLLDGQVEADRPNRVIAVNDAPNEHLVLADELPGLLARASAVLVSGLNTMKSREELGTRLDELARALEAVPEGVEVVYEDAGFHDDSLRAVVRDALGPLVSLHSLNEDEAQGYLGRAVDLADPAEVAAMMHDLHHVLGAPAVMVHTSRYAAVTGHRAEVFREAGEAGCRVAATRFVHGDAYGPAEYAAVARSRRQEVGLRLAAVPEVVGAGVLVAPGFEVRSERPTTIGLGDAFIGGVVGRLAGAL
ncbi:ADP-dependent glucokinase/phosphofructokinase [Actinomyces howellii]|uniref:ADP-dependent glucokinase n=1 Tax=Actinomyces howellii TaxID=52771 RepID=A0A3S4R1Z6_9ACTO|nr:ADP-dependent glucokinase/phosphofructokinase [Actinomyces howellii]VEG29458.1 ADP-dependent glucokinase [Actinomyces howellii]